MTRRPEGTDIAENPNTDGVALSDIPEQLGAAITLDRVVVPQGDSQPKLESYNAAHRAIRQSVENTERKAEALANAQAKFIFALRDYLQSLGLHIPIRKFRVDDLFDDDGKFTPNQFCKQLIDRFNILKKSSPSDSLLIEEITGLLGVLYKKDEIPNRLVINDAYLTLYKSIWGIPSYLEEQMRRREFLDGKKHGKYGLIASYRSFLKVEADEQGAEINEENVKAEEEAIYHEIANPFLDTLNLLYDEQIPEIYRKELATSSISELQEIWQREEGITKKSWEIKHHAFIKLMIFHALISVMGTINFLKKKENKKELQRMINLYFNRSKRIRRIEVNLKDIISSVLKALKHYLVEMAIPDPRRIIDLVRLRVDSNLPECILESHNLDEYHLYLEEDLAYLMDVFGHNYEPDRLRNGVAGNGNVNKNSVGSHDTFHITIYVYVWNSRSRCPEKIPLEAHISPRRSDEEQKKDDERYAENKKKELRSLLGTEVKFDHFLNHVADLFNKDLIRPDEKDGGSTVLSEMEVLGIKMLRILATADPETIEYLTECFRSNSEITYQKFQTAIDKFRIYWSKKLDTFREKMVLIFRTIIYDEKERLKRDTRHYQANEPMIAILRQMLNTIDNGISKNTSLAETIRILKTVHLSYNPLFGRLTKITDQMEKYHSNHDQSVEIQAMMSQAYAGLSRMFPQQTPTAQSPS